MPLCMTLNCTLTTVIILIARSKRGKGNDCYFNVTGDMCSGRVIIRPGFPEQVLFFGPCPGIRAGFHSLHGCDDDDDDDDVQCFNVHLKAD